MSEENLNVGIILDTTDAKRDLNEIDAQTKKVNLELEKTKENTRDTMVQTISVVRASYGILRGVLKAAGITTSSVTNAVIQAMFMSAQAFAQLAAAEAKTPFTQAAAIITAIQAGVIIAQAMQAEKESKDISREIEATSLILGNVNMMMGVFNH
jgi:hypothetical protein